jgi:hypothetical protein
MNDYEELQVSENTTELACQGKLSITVMEVGVDMIALKLGTPSGPESAYNLPVNNSIRHDGGGEGKFELILIGIKEGDLEKNIPASAVLRVRQLCIESGLYRFLSREGS